MLNSTDDIKALLDENLNNLNQISSNKHIGALLDRVRFWEKNLNKIGEVIDNWLLVQKKWIYLEGIYLGSDDIRQQLRDEAKAFDKNHSAFLKLMDGTWKNPNVYVCCATDVRLKELKSLLFVRLVRAAGQKAEKSERILGFEEKLFREILLFARRGPSQHFGNLRHFCGAAAHAETV